MASPRERDHHGESSSARRVKWTGGHQPSPSLPVHHPWRPHFHETPPWPHHRYHDYALVEGGGWWPRWYPYWNEQWRTYWWQLYDYYGGDAYADYAASQRDALLRANAAQWGLMVNAPSSQIGSTGYGAAYADLHTRHLSTFDQIKRYRSVALDSARKINAATGAWFFGYRDSPWGSEISVFGTRAGLQRWANEQARIPEIWYAVTFDLSSSTHPLSEVTR